MRTADEMGWSELGNGALLAAAEEEFDLMSTTDQSLPYQQNLVGRQLAILVLPTTSSPLIQKHVDQIADAVAAMQPGEVREITFS